MLVDIRVRQKRYDMRHKMLTQRNPFVITSIQKRECAESAFATHVVLPLGVRGVE
jgi:hypothetical protein